MNRQKFINPTLGLKPPKVKPKKKKPKKKAKSKSIFDDVQTFGPQDTPIWREANGINRNARIAYMAAELYHSLEEATMTLLEVMHNANQSSAAATKSEGAISYGEYRRIRQLIEQCRDVLDRSRDVMR